MDQDLQDLLALWLGDHDPGEDRRNALLARLRDDSAFRAAFVAEIRLLGMLKAVQAPEPRWLRLEDEIGWSARQREDVEELARQVVREGKRRKALKWVRRWLVAAALLVAVSLYLTFRAGRALDGQPDPSAAGRVEVATAVRIEGVQWEEESEALREGSVVLSGRLRLREGRLTLTFYSGATLTVEGPADLELQAPERIFCHYGKVRARVPRGAEGFTVQAAGYEVVDLGTEFGLNLEPGGRSQVMVFEGEAALSVIGKDGRSVGGALLGGRRAVEVDPDAGSIQDVPAQPEAFVPLGKVVPAPLELAPRYAREIRDATPWGYWRFESMADGVVPNEIEGRPALKALGGVELESSPGGNRWARFRLDDHTQAFLLDGEWARPRDEDYAIEVWVQADLPSPNAFGQTALVSLIATDDKRASNHVAYLELAARGRRFLREPCAVRFLDRWPAAMTGGTDVFSRRNVMPSQWHHIVGQKVGDVLELYVDGEQVGTSRVKPNEPDPEAPLLTPCYLLVGRLKQRSLPPNVSEIRPFEGRLDELAVYDHPLTPEVIRHHAGLRLAGAAP
jgi:hypothetical protein